MRHVFVALLCTFLFAGPAPASDADEVRDLLKTKVDAVLVLLRDQTMDKDRRDESITAIVTPIFAYETMAKLSLGKEHWSALRQEQQSEFSRLFIERLQESYLEKLNIYSDEQVVYGEPQAEGAKVRVPTTLISKGSRIEMLYKFYRSKTGWMIYDVEIGGVSIIQSYRSQFDDLLSAGTFDELLDKLGTNGTLILPAAAADDDRTRSK